MDNEITKALAAQDQHDACEDCGKRTDGLMTCTYSHDGSTIKLCPDCMEGSGFCFRCGYYCAGMNGFDGIYCSDCSDEIDAEFGDDDDEWQPWDGWHDPYDPEDDFDSRCEDNNPNDSRNL